MRRLLATVRWDVTLQVRNGFYAATAFVGGFWALLLLQVGALDLRWLLPPMLLGNLLIGTFYFIGAQVLLERSEATLAAQAVTPLRLGEYLASKTLTLSALALAETMVLAPLLAGWRFNAALLAAGVLVGGVIYCLCGFIAAVRYPAVSEYLLPSAVYVTLLWLPLLTWMVGWQPWVVLLHPLSAPLVLIEAAFAPAPPGALLYGFGYAALWIALLWVWSHRAARRWLLR